MPNLDALSTDWKKTLGAWSEDELKVEHWFNYLVSRYSSSDRKYHTLEHVEFMLGLAYQNRCFVDNWLAFYLAIWFHDVIQNRPGRNEKLSAKECLKAIKDLRLPKSAMKALELILATAKHVPDISNDAKLLVDLDLAILGAEAGEYEKYAAHCRAEFDVPNWLYRTGRGRVIKRFLKRKYIYATHFFRENLEKKARKNLKWELENIMRGASL